MRGAGQLEDLLGLQLQLVEAVGSHELELLLAALVLFAVDEVVGEVFEADFLVAE